MREGGCMRDKLHHNVAHFLQILLLYSLSNRISKQLVVEK